MWLQEVLRSDEAIIFLWTFFFYLSFSLPSQQTVVCDNRGKKHSGRIDNMTVKGETKLGALKENKGRTKSVGGESAV